MVEHTTLKEFELIYWPGNFAGRGEYVRLLLEVCGQTYRDVGREADGLAKVLAVMKQEEQTPYPVLHAPYLRHKGTIICQLPAIMLYIASLFDMIPQDPIDAAHAMQVSMTALDILGEAEMAYHPLKKNDSYESQKDAAEPVIQAWMAERLPKFLNSIERALKANKWGTGWVVTDKMTYADVVVF